MSVSINTPSGRTMASAATVVSSTTASQNPAQAPTPPHWTAHRPDTGPRNRATAKLRPHAPDRPRGRIRQSQAAPARMAARRAVRHRLFEHLPHHRRRGMLCATQAESRPRLVRVSRGVSLGHGYRIRLPRRGDLSDCLRAVGSLAQHRGGPSYVRDRSLTSQP